MLPSRTASLPSTDTIEATAKGFQDGLSSSIVGNEGENDREVNRKRLLAIDDWACLKVDLLPPLRTRRSVRTRVQERTMMPELDLGNLVEPEHETCVSSVNDKEEMFDKLLDECDQQHRATSIPVRETWSPFEYIAGSRLDHSPSDGCVSGSLQACHSQSSLKDNLRDDETGEAVWRFTTLETNTAIDAPFKSDDDDDPFQLRHFLPVSKKGRKVQSRCTESDKRKGESHRQRKAKKDLGDASFYPTNPLHTHNDTFQHSLEEEEEFDSISPDSSISQSPWHRTRRV